MISHVEKKIKFGFKMMPNINSSSSQQKETFKKIYWWRIFLLSESSIHQFIYSKEIINIVM